MSIKNEQIEREEYLISELEKLGWVYGYLSGHGDSERVYKTIGDKYMVVADIEKMMVLCPPSSVHDEPYEE